MNKKIVVTVFSHPDCYPPTLNAIRVLSNEYSEVIVVCRNVLKSDCNFPDNVIFKKSGKYKFIKDLESVSIFKKIYSFFLYCLTLLSCIRKYQPQILLVYDPTPLFAFKLIQSFISHQYILWYHNHDTPDIRMVRQYSVSWWAAKHEHTIFLKYVKFFSLPSDERKRFYPMEQFKGNYFLIPNYPSKHFFSQFYSPKQIGQTIRLIFQGAIGKGHGLESIAEILDKRIEGKRLHLVLKGIMEDKTYDEKLRKIASLKSASTHIETFGYGPYDEVPLITRTCDIGIGIHSFSNDLHTTLAKASNKLYEYAALGLPIIVFDSEHYRKYLDCYDWVFFAKDNSASILKQIEAIITNYTCLSKQARQDFLDHLNFENYFATAISAADNYLVKVQKE